MTEPLITFVRLPEVSIREVLDVLNEPRNGRHLPLAGERFTETTAAKWVAAKDGQWEMHGYGPWAVRVDGEFAGWGGFQHEENGADFALVLKPTHWGHGAAVTRAVLTPKRAAPARPSGRPIRLRARRRRELRRNDLPPIPARPQRLARPPLIVSAQGEARHVLQDRTSGGERSRLQVASVQPP